ncbi:hypothetical protein [Raineya sp.]|jgi:hypothetical protein
MQIRKQDRRQSKKNTKELVLIAFFLSFVGIALAQTSQKNYPLNLRNFDENKIKEIKKNPEFDYSEDIDEYKEYDRDWQWKQWRYEEHQRNNKKDNWKAEKFRERDIPEFPNITLGESFVYVAITILIIFLILMLLGFDVRSWFAFNKKVNDEAIIIEENLEAISKDQLEASLQKAITQKRYNEALRYAYLKALQLLANKNLIELSKQKTNLDYQIELRQKRATLSENFRDISTIFAYIKYGEFIVSQEQFASIYPHFESFYQKI